MPHRRRASSKLNFAGPTNDSAFMNQSVFDYCKGRGLVQTRSRAYKKNDQAWVEQKNGAVVRRLVGYGRLSGVDARNALAQLYASSRLSTNATAGNSPASSTSGSSGSSRHSP